MRHVLDGANIYYEEKGDGRPVLMLHGGGVDHRQMVEYMEPVFEEQEGWRRIYLDLPGHGCSRVAKNICNHDQILDILLEFINKVLPDGRFSVIGNSRGGYLARGIAYKVPELLEGLCLVVPARHSTVSPKHLPPRGALVFDPDTASRVEEHEKTVFDNVVVQSAHILEFLRRVVFPALELSDKSYQRRIMQRFEFSFDIDHPPAPFMQPALIITGRQDAFVGYSDSFRALEQFPRATYAVLDRAGHLLGFEQPGLLRALIVEWLQRVKDAAVDQLTE